MGVVFQRRETIPRQILVPGNFLKETFKPQFLNFIINLCVVFLLIADHSNRSLWKRARSSISSSQLDPESLPEMRRQKRSESTDRQDNRADDIAR